MKLYASSSSSVSLLLVLISTLSLSAAAFRTIGPGQLGRTLRHISPSRVNKLVAPSSCKGQSSFSRVQVTAAASTLEAPPPAPSNINSTLIGGSWECNEDAECVEVPQCNEEECRTSLDVRIHGEWYDLTGTLQIKLFNGPETLYERVRMGRETYFTLTL